MYKTKTEIKCEICGSEIDINDNSISKSWCGDNKYAYHVRCVEQKYWREWK